MNKLSLLFYLADMFNSLDIMVIFLGCVSLIAGLIMVSFTCSSDCRPERKPRWGRRSAFYIMLAVMLFSAAVATPSKDTMYAIAASEMGEQVLKSETGSLITKALNAWLRKQLN